MRNQNLFLLCGAALLCASMILGSAASAQSEDDLLGPWKMNINAAGQDREMNITFNKENGELGALISTPDGDQAAQNVKLEGDQLSWHVSIGPIELDMLVTVDGATFAGINESPFGPIDVKAKKYTEEELAAMGARYDHLIGDWDTVTVSNGITYDSKLRMAVVDGQLLGAIMGGGGHVRPGDEDFNYMFLKGNELSWEVQIPYMTQNGGKAIVTLSDAGTFEGTVSTSLGDISIRGKLVDTASLVSSPYDDPSPILGDWKLTVNFSGQDGDALLNFSMAGERLHADLLSEIGTLASDNVQYEKIGDTMGTIRVEAVIEAMGPDPMVFEFIVDGDTLEGEEINTDGMILVTGAKATAEEAEALRAAASEPTEVTAALVMQMLDRDKDGLISLEEAPEQLQANFPMVDQNADGGIDLEEAEIVAMFMNSQ